MNKSEKILKLLSSFVENGILSSKDVKKEVLTNLKFQKDSLIQNLKLVPREEFDVLKKIVQKQDKEIKHLKKALKTKKVKRL
jgi:BMFP domain-containing protein YqiC|tara:strand:+ start:776 stop:1021 length:246 start_codon:yes stop_codon:yes gene_type:complete